MSFHTPWLSLSVFALIAQLALGAGDPAVVETKDAGVDFKIQGEYVGKTTDNDTWGAHVIALGDNKFEIVGYYGGLPGEGWKRGDRVEKGSAELKGNVAEGNGDQFSVKIADGVFTIYQGGEKVGELKKTDRKSKSLGAKPPEGAVVLFDGKNADAWVNGKTTTVDGETVLTAGNVETKQKFGDHSLHIEFRTPYMAKSRGQGRGNSGVYIQSRYELQVLDSFGLDGADNECGGIYSINKPNVNMCYPPMSWQTYDIDFKAAQYDAAGKKTTNARTTIRHNGVVIHDNLELTKGTPGRHEEGPGPDSIFLQDHGNPVVYRNIWVVERK